VFPLQPTVSRATTLEVAVGAGAVDVFVVLNEIEVSDEVKFKESVLESNVCAPAESFSVNA